MFHCSRSDRDPTKRGSLSRRKALMPFASLAKAEDHRGHSRILIPTNFTFTRQTQISCAPLAMRQKGGSSRQRRTYSKRTKKPQPCRRRCGHTSQLWPCSCISATFICGGSRFFDRPASLVVSPRSGK